MIIPIFLRPGNALRHGKRLIEDIDTKNGVNTIVHDHSTVSVTRSDRKIIQRSNPASMKQARSILAILP